MPSAVKLREDFSSEELRALARGSKDVNQSDITPIFLPSRAPELNPVENV